jgi:hypothetical protein
MNRRDILHSIAAPGVRAGAGQRFATTAFAGTVTLHVLSGGVKLPADALNAD